MRLRAPASGHSSPAVTQVEFQDPAADLQHDRRARSIGGRAFERTPKGDGVGYSLHPDGGFVFQSSPEYEQNASISLLHQVTDCAGG